MPVAQGVTAPSGRCPGQSSTMDTRVHPSISPNTPFVIPPARPRPDLPCHQRCREDGGFRMSARNPDQGAPKRVATFRGSPFAAAIPGDSVAEAVITSGLSSFLSLYNSAIVVRLILTWFPNPPPAIVAPLSTVCDPYLNLFRGIIPPLGGTIDLSPILAFIALDVFTNSAAALPSETAPGGRVSRGLPAPSRWGPALKARFEATRARKAAEKAQQ